MRTTIEISDQHRGMLLSLAARKGLRGYSALIQEALDQYIAGQAKELETKEKVLAMRGSWQRGEAEQTRARLLALRKKWNVS